MSTPPVIVDATEGRLPSSGLFIVGSARYAVVLDTSSGIQVYKSLGSTWTLMDGLNSVLTTNTGLGATEHSGKLYVVGIDVTDSFIVISVFNTSSDTWESSTVTGTPWSVSSRIWCKYRVADNYLIIYAPEEAQFFPYTWSNGGYCLFDTIGLSCGPWFRVDASIPAATFTGFHPSLRFAVGIVQGNGRVHFIEARYDSLGYFYDIYQIPFTDGNALGTAQLIYSYSSGGGTSGQGGNQISLAPIAFGDGLSLVILLGNQTDAGGVVNVLTYIKAPVIASNTLSFSTATLSLPDNLISAGLTINSGNIFVVLNATVMALNGFVYYEDSGAGLGSPTVMGVMPSGTTFVIGDAGNDPSGVIGLLLSSTGCWYWPGSVVVSGYASSGGTLVGSGSYASVG